MINWRKLNRTLALNQQGFTLAELMIVVALIAAIGAIVGPKIFNQFDKAKVSNTKTQLRMILTTLQDFKRECGFFPSTDQGLQALLTKPTAGRECKNYDPEGYLSSKKVPVDAWNLEFKYIETAGKIEVKSLGADGADGGEGLNADISSDNLD